MVWMCGLNGELVNLNLCTGIRMVPDCDPPDSDPHRNDYRIVVDCSLSFGYVVLFDRQTKGQAQILLSSLRAALIKAGVVWMFS